MEIISSLASAVGGGGVVGMLVVLLLRRALEGDRAERRLLAAKLDQLECEKIKKIEDKIDNHVAADQSPAILAALERIGKLDGKVDEHVAADKSQKVLAKLELLHGGMTVLQDKQLVVLERTAHQEARLAGISEWLRNINQDLSDHLKQHIGGGQPRRPHRQQGETNGN